MLVVKYHKKVGKSHHKELDTCSYEERDLVGSVNVSEPVSGTFT